MKFSALGLHTFVCLFINAAMQHPKSAPVIGLDILRFLAAASVMFYHFVYLVGEPGHTPYRLTHGLVSFPALAPFAEFGWLGVEMFFLISGFVISMSAAGATPRKFFEGRVLRLVPTAWICATATLVVALLVQDGSVLSLASRYLHSLLFIPIGQQIDGTYWTLGVEVMFYSAVWMILSLGQWTRFYYFIVALGLASTIFNVMRFPDFGEYNLTNRLFELSLLKHGCEFAAGALVYMMISGGKKWRYILPFLVCVVGATYELTNFLLLQLGGQWDPNKFLVVFSLWSFLLTLFLASVFLNDFFIARASDRLCSSIRTLGMMTYPLYLLHQLIGSALLFVLVREGVSSSLALAVTVLSMILLACLVLITETKIHAPMKGMIHSIVGTGLGLFRLKSFTRSQID